MRLDAFGSNGSGQLGIGNLGDILGPQPCQFHTLDGGSEPAGLPRKVVAGGNSTYVLFDNGDLYRAGRGAQLSDDQKPWSSTKFEETRSRQDRKTKLCSSTWDAAIFVDKDDKVFVEGSGPAGELSLGPEIKHSTTAKKLHGFPPYETKMLDIASSVSHTVVVLSNGEVWGWGNGRKGQLGEPAQVVWEARKITNIGFEVVRVVCGREFTFLLGESSTGRHIVLGSDKWGVKSGAPEDIRNWRDVGASWGSLFVLDSAGLIKSWGRNDRGQLTPPGLPAIEQLAVGSEHVLALSKEGHFLVWGWGEHGNCGAYTDDEGNVNGIWNEFSIDNLEPSAKILGIGAGCATSFLWTSSTLSGQLFSCVTDHQRVVPR